MKQLKKSRFIPLIIGIILSIALCACSGSDDDTVPPDVVGSETGDVVISLTDAAGDFINYTVDVVAVKLIKANGTEVNTLPVSTTVDFAQYVEMTEFLTVATIPAGVYTKAILTLDYQNAYVAVENEVGDSVEANVLDEDGNSITQIDVSVHLENKNKLIIAKGIPAHLSLDFDLKASNNVEFNQAGNATVIVEPSLIAALEPEADKMNRLRGPLKQVNVEENSFEVIIRPFFHSLKGKNEKFGKLKVIVSDSTVYDINGESYQGSEGLLAMDELALQNTGVVALGNIKFKPLRFEANEVTAGSSVPGGTQDAVKGNVIARNGDRITVKGVTLIRTDGRVDFKKTVTVQLSENTQVTKQLSTDEYTLDDISIGQHVLIFGTILDDEPDGQLENQPGDQDQDKDQVSTGHSMLDMDATDGYIRMQLTTLRGRVLETTLSDYTTQLTLNLKSIDRCPVRAFDFTGTGTDESNDATPDNYRINTGELDLTAIAANAFIKLRGFVEPFGQAPADFKAHTIIHTAKARAYMKVSWHPESEAAFDSITSTGLTLNLENTSRFHHVGRGWNVINLKDLASVPVIQPLSAEGEGVFIIKAKKENQVHKNFADFANDLNERTMEEDITIKQIFATGAFDDETATLSARYIQVKFR